jgi:hypothetical protein
VAASPDPRPRMVSRRDVLRITVALVGPPVLASCAFSDPTVDDPHASSRLTPAGASAGTPASPSSSATPAVDGAPAAAAAEERLAALGSAILGGPHRRSLSGRQGGLLRFVAATHAAHAAVLAPPSPIPPPKIGQLSLQQSLALLSHREATAGIGYGRSALGSQGRDALLWGSLSVASASIASAVTAAKPPGVTAVRAHRPAALLSDVEAVQQLVAQLHAMVYGYQLAIGRLPVLGKPHTRAIQQLLETRILRDRQIAWLEKRSAAVPAAEPAYVPSTVPHGAASSAKLIQQLQVAFLPFCGLWLAAADDRDRPGALATLRSVHNTAGSWGAPLTAWPGW